MTSVGTAPPVGNTTSNVAGANATVGVQTGEMNNSTVYHNSTVYTVAPNADPKRKYDVGIRYLDSGVPLRARSLIGEAIANGFDTAEVRFHWTLAMLSKRALRDLTAAEHHELDSARLAVACFGVDDWVRGLEAIFGFVDHSAEPDSQHGARAMAALVTLPPDLNAKIVHHLELVIAGTHKDQLWSDTRVAAEQGRYANDRQGRVWAYFHPIPAEPKARPPKVESTTAVDAFKAGAWTILLTAGLAQLGWAVLDGGDLWSVIAYLGVLVPGAVAARTGWIWRYKTERLAAKEWAHFAVPIGRREFHSSFAKKVNGSFTHNMNKYAPPEEKKKLRKRWFQETAGLRATLHDEIVELYKGSKIAPDRVRWLIRVLVADMRKRWNDEVLWNYREDLRTGWPIKVLCAAAAVTLALSTVVVVVASFSTMPVRAVIAALVLLVAGWYATRGWYRITSERRRYFDETAEYIDHLTWRRDAYQAWKQRLDETRPEEEEMEAWLNCDKTLVLNNALRHYGLAWRNVVAYAFLRTPAEGHRRARRKYGPWWYSRYEVRVFLVTDAGVRAVTAELAFQDIQITDLLRTNFRFDAVSSVDIVKDGRYGYSLELSLMNGDPKEITVTHNDTGTLDQGESADTFSRINLDSAGFAHTLHILEGMAAEGRHWMAHETQANRPTDHFGLV
ncbi:hypothetical protein JOD54_004897 [Actinokineospora baliensis]|uniref:hypothetical protein n=1 Tax=Actinokineospora baliensis TaxID=547056 RepID=UPI00195BEDA1|nr:hypothetical protein [Actinokineospora baliensis]MBM7774693.1 hypothetical protein [Actinokineospora baliensis]